MQVPDGVRTVTVEGADLKSALVSAASQLEVHPSQIDHKIDMSHFRSALGTSGTFTGTARFLKSQSEAVEVVSLQPDSPYHALEGWKHMETALIPAIYDEGLADRNLEVPSDEALDLTRRLAREEGLLTGPSGGGAVWGAIEVAKGLTEGVVVTLLPDGGDRYLSHSYIFGA